MGRCSDGRDPRPRGSFGSDEGENALKRLHEVATLDGFGSFTRTMLAAAGGLIAYLDHVGRGTMPFLLPPVARAGEERLAMDEATRARPRNPQQPAGRRAGSLIAAIDRCVTGAGARQLAEDLSAPLTDAGAITARLALVQYFARIRCCVPICAKCCAARRISAGHSGGS